MSENKQPWIGTHDEAISALCNCAATVTVLSYQEAIEGYIAMRGLTIEKIDALSAKIKLRAETGGGEDE